MPEKISIRRLTRVLTEDLGFELRIRSSHHIFTRPGTGILFNLQPFGNDEVKPYQLAQVKKVLLDNGIVSEGELQEVIRKAQRS